MQPDPVPEQQPQEMQVQLTPWGWDFALIGEIPGGKVALIKIVRQLGETINLIAAVEDLKRFHDALGAKLREFDSGLVLPPPGWAPPPNGHRP